jgi:molybdopterin-guanine dinucleotide biosynthesis protein A
MHTDKAFLEIDGEPLWRRQVHLLQALEPHELFVAGQPREGCIAIPDAQPDIGPLGGLVSGLRSCSTPLLLVLAIDLPRMTSDYLRRLIARSSETSGAVPRGQPVSAVYPRRALSIAECCLTNGEHSMQNFAARCLSEGLVRQEEIVPADEHLFLNLNTPEDLLALTNA